MVSEKHLSYFNLVSVSTSLDKLPNPKKNYPHKYSISKIFKNKVTGHNELVIYNATNKNWKNISLDNIHYMKQPCKHHAFGEKSGYYFIYDNQGLIYVIFDNLKICELNLPDKRIDPTLFIYEKNIDQSILFVAGGNISLNSSMVVMDTVAVFYLNFKEIGKLYKHEPIFYIKLKYPRMNPTIFKIKEKNELIFIFMGGNNIEEIDKINHSKEGNKKKSIQFFINEANLFCETISFKMIKDQIFKSDFTNIQVIPTEGSLMITTNNTSASENKPEKIRFFLTEGAIIKVPMKSHRNKVPYLFGIGKKKNEIWFVDKFDFVEHKLFLLKSRYKLAENKDLLFCKPMITLLDNELFYFKKADLQAMKFEKMKFKGDFSSQGNKACGAECRLF